MLSLGVVLLAAGRGSRFKGKKPKQFTVLNGQALFLHSLRVFLNLSAVTKIALVIPQKQQRGVSRYLRSIPSTEKIVLVEGGRYRGESVRNGVLALSRENSVILIHDSARPFVTRGIVERVARAAMKTGVALAAWPLSDTLKRATQQDLVRTTIRRDALWTAQTPQGFRFEIATRCLLRPSPTATDDVELAERKGYRVRLVKGAPENYKITTTQDIRFCRRGLR